MHLTSAAALLLLGLATPLAQASDIEERGVNDACAAQPGGYGPVASPNTAIGFVHYGPFNTVSTAATTPSNYQRTFHVQLASTTGNGYQGLYTLQSYDVAGCASMCNGTPRCQGFNVFYERDPTLNPAPACSNPTAMTNIKCTLWALPPTVQNATNSGETRSAFQVVIAGSNGYAKIGSVPLSTVDNGNNPYI